MGETNLPLKTKTTMKTTPQLLIPPQPDGYFARLDHQGIIWVRNPNAAESQPMKFSRFGPFDNLPPDIRASVPVGEESGLWAERNGTLLRLRPVGDACQRITRFIEKAQAAHERSTEERKASRK